MLHATVIFFIIGLIAAVFGFAGIVHADTARFACLVFFVCMLMAVISFIADTASTGYCARKAAEKERKARERQAADDLRRARIQWLRDQFPMGQEFSYLGRDCMPTKHTELRREYCGTDVGEWYWQEHPRLFADYADDHGVIHSVEFSYAEAVAIACETGAP
jgi:uncharacterized membrane protein YtjA (UPF0391 family)